MHIVFWFNAYSIVKRFSFSSASVERFLGLAGDFVFNYISSTPATKVGWVWVFQLRLW